MPSATFTILAGEVSVSYGLGNKVEVSLTEAKYSDLIAGLDTELFLEHLGVDRLTEFLEDRGYDVTEE